MKRRAFKLATVAFSGATALAIVGAGPASATSFMTVAHITNAIGVDDYNAPSHDSKILVHNNVIKTDAPQASNGCTYLGYVAADGRYETDCNAVAGSVVTWNIAGQNGKDTITLRGGFAGAQVNVQGGPGGDIIDTFDGVAENVSCGAADNATDTVTVDQYDSVSKDCAHDTVTVKQFSTK